MTSACDKRTSASMSPNDDFVRRTRNPALTPPARFERVPKKAGSKVLVRGEWVTLEKDES